MVVSVCRGSQWTCSKRPCPGTCSTYGESNYITFDGKRFSYSGACEYIITSDFCDGRNGSFRIQSLNVPCGPSGVACSKKATVTIGDTVISFERGVKPKAKPLPGAATFTTWFRLHEVHFFTVLETMLGLTVMWDRGTRLYITLDPKYQGKGDTGLVLPSEKT